MRVSKLVFATNNAIKRQLQPISCNQNLFFPLRISRLYLEIWVNIIYVILHQFIELWGKKPELWEVNSKLQSINSQLWDVKLKWKCLQLPFNNLFMLCIYFFHSGNKLLYETINDEELSDNFFLKKKNIYIYTVYCVETVYMSMHSSLLDMNMRSINTEFKNKFAN